MGGTRRAFEAFRDATKVSHRKSVAHVPHDRALRAAAKRALWFEPVVFSGTQAQAVGAGFQKFVLKSGIIVRACAILPCHVHLVIERHRYDVEQIVNLPKGAATRELVARQLFPSVGKFKPRIWSRGCRKVFIDDQRHLQAEIKYVQNNPVQ